MAKKKKFTDEQLNEFIVTKIQAMAAEGSNGNIDIENAIYMTNVSKGVPGTTNNYKAYNEQVNETYKKYNGRATWGNQQARAVLDIRSSFISGGGVSMASKNDKFKKWYKNFIRNNQILGSRFFDAILGAEITGKCLFNIKPVKDGGYPRVIRIPYNENNAYRVVLDDPYDPDSVSDIVVDVEGVDKSLGLQNFVYIRTGGDDLEVNETTTRTGVILNDLESYDRALKDLRLNNHVTARITPTFETQSDKETNEISTKLKRTGWKIGKAYVGTAKFRYASPATGTIENLKAEMATCIKTIAAPTGVPVHWIGWTDLMANRSTADSLNKSLQNATIRERSLFVEGIYNLVLKAQELYIDGGGTDISEVVTDFSIVIPMIDINELLDTIKAMSFAFKDGIISRSDYQNHIPGIDPIKTEEALAAEREEAEARGDTEDNKDKTEDEDGKTNEE